ncbi:Ser-Thr-rich glycosyl-phosphatidyl-inositol-anchored membrane family protein [Phycisphaerae bacterium RAS1]|nr:Ser-Thr-rich glycosyl-phosphatidyl-inositol-anchored membrane family protein [Phycisphaerae bacterium RAS1]
MTSATTRSALRDSLHLAVLLCALVLTPSAGARSNIRSAFFAVYPNAVGSVLDSVPSHPVHCGVCHYNFNGGGARNPYGQRVELALPGFPNNSAGRAQAIASVAGIDAEGDNFGTQVEATDTTSYVNTPTFPGLSAANVGGVSNVNQAELLDYLTPVTGGDTTPPVVTVISPNGGETYVGNASTTVQWTATDPSGIGATSIFVSLDNGGTWKPLALNLFDTNSFTWFVANRPTTQAKIRVVALDNYFNEGSDESDAVFNVIRPPGGIAPTTLRDFDMPGSQPLQSPEFFGPTACDGCHGSYDMFVEQLFTWQGGMMAHASRDPLFLASVSVANQDAPDSGDLCLRCHMSSGWLRGRSVPTDGSQLLAIDKHGVSCETCHYLVDPFYEPGVSPPIDADILAGLTNPPTESGNGMYVVDPNGTRRGPFADAAAAHDFLYSPFHREAALCGTCHDVSNPAFEKNGNGNYVPNAFDTPASNLSANHLLPVERTYSEWLNSAYNSPTGVYAPAFGGNREYVRVCQDCHMRAITGYGCSLAGTPLRSDLPSHDQAGGSTWMLARMPELYPNEVNANAIVVGISRAQYMLQNAADMLALQQGDQLHVSVTNNTGHKLPTGYPEGRRIWINVRFFNAAMELIAESAAYNAATGVLTEDPTAKVYETKPGLDSITAPLVGEPEGPSFHFVLNNRIWKDNRIPPRGFNNAAFANFGGAPVGAAYADGQYWDDTDYTIPAGTVHAEVRLYYQSMSKELVEFLRDENVTDLNGQFMYDVWNNNGKSPPELMRLAALDLISWILGDMNCDGELNILDINPFVLALGDPAAYTAAFPNCNIALGDLNNDGEVNVLDINPFIAALGG